MKRDFVGTYMEPTVEQRCRYATLYQLAKLCLGEQMKRDVRDLIGNWDAVRFQNEIQALRVKLKRSGVDEQALVENAIAKNVHVYPPLRLQALERFQYVPPENVELRL